MRSITHSRRSLLRSTLAWSAGVMLARTANAQAEWPDRPVRLVVPFPPGGSGDALARIIGQDVAKRLSQPVVVDNKPGGNMFIGAAVVEKAPADGYTFLLTLDSLFTINPFAYDKLPYDPAGFAAVSQITSQAQCFVARKSLGVNSMADLLRLAREQPGRLNFGYGSPPAHLAAELLRMNTGVQMTLVPYKGGAPLAMALLAQEIDVIALDPSLLLQHINSGKLSPLGQVGVKRSQMLPQLPTLFEQGIKGFERLGWFGVFAPVKTPAPVIARMSREIVTAIAQPDVQRQILALGFDPVSSTPQDLTQRWHEDARSWERVVRSAGIKLTT